MRQGQQQNRQRSRGRNNNRNNNNNRNQLNRSMESNGPDVRIRGTAAHIAEKYTQLARDAQTSGDTVAAESYWQFAEHYNRLIAVAQAAQAEEQAKRDEERAKRNEERGEQADDADGEEGRGRNRRGRGRRGRDDDVAAKNEPAETTDEANVSKPGDGPQPVIEDLPVEAAAKDVAADGADEAPVKPRRARRPRKPVETAAEEAPSELPSFISGAAE